MEIHQKNVEPWSVTLVDTGDDTMTGGRLKRVSKYLGEEDFCLTYGDGLSDVRIDETIEFHKSGKQLATVVAIQPPGRFGSLDVVENRVVGFREKPQGDGRWINGGFFVLSREVLKYVSDDETIWERDPMERLAAEDNLAAFLHRGFWQPMDTLRDKNLLDELWSSGGAPWKVW